MVSFIKQAAAVYPDNADVSRQLILLGDTIGKQVKEQRQQDRLLSIGQAAKTGGVAGVRDAAFGAGLLDVGLSAEKILASQQPKLTDEQREYAQATQQGFKGSFFDYKTALKKAGATNVNVNTGEKSYDTKLGGAYAERFLEAQKAGQGALGEMATLDTMEKLTQDPGFYSGVGAEKFVLPLKQAVSRFGGDPNAAASMETFRALSNKNVLDTMGGSLGTGFSNADRDFVVGQVANLGNTPEGNRQLIAINKKVARRKQEIAKLARDYSEANGGRLDAGFDRALANFAEKNPLFKKDGGNSTSTGVKWRVLE